MQLPRARVKRHADKRGGSHEARANGRKGGAGHAAACRSDGSPPSAAKPAATPTGQLAANGGNCQSGSHASMKRVIRPPSLLRFNLPVFLC